jgi:hypothetical protein
MSTTARLNSAALFILQQANAQPASGDEAESSGGNLVAAANGISIPSVNGAHSQAKAKISDALFDNSVSVQEMKVNLMRRLGEELGISMDDFERPAEYASAIRDVIAKIKAQPEGALFLAELEKKLGLDELGVSLDDLVDAISSTDGEGARKLDAALRDKLGENAKDAAKNGAEAAYRAMRTDETGLYGF